jgi:hypothetical protein
MKKISFVLVVLIFLSSCRSTKQEVQESTLDTSKERVVTYRDTIIYTEPSKTELSVSIADLLASAGQLQTDGRLSQSDGRLSQTNGNATVKLGVKDNRIIATAYCDSIALKAKIKREVLRDMVLKTNNNSKTTKISLPWTYYLLAFGCGFALATILFITFKFKNLF